MCSPTLALTALSIGSSVMQARAQNRAAEQQYEIGRQQYALTERNRRLEQEALTARQRELREDAGNEGAAIARAEAQERAAQLVASAEGGAGGNTALALLRDIGFDAGLQQVALQRQFKRNIDQTEREKQATNLNAQTANTNTASQLASVQTASPLSTGLSIAGSIAQGASDGAFRGIGSSSTLRSPSPPRTFGGGQRLSFNSARAR